MARQRDEPVVRVGIDRNRGRAEVGHEAVDEPIALGVRAGERRQEPRCALEELPARVLRAARLRAADRVAADEPRRASAAEQAAALVEPTSVTVHRLGAQLEDVRRPAGRAG